MFVIKALLLAVETICSLLLVLIILVQRTKGGGLGMAFGAGMGEQLFGSRAGNVLTKLTVILGSIFVVNTIILAGFYTSAEKDKSLMQQHVGATAPVNPTVPDAATPPGGVPVELPASLPVPPSGDAPVPVPVPDGAAVPAPAPVPVPVPAPPAGAPVPEPSTAP